MRYEAWAVVALLSYTVFPPLVSIATREIPSNVAAVSANLVFVVSGLVVIYVSGDQFVPYLLHEKAAFMWVGGVFLTIGLLAYYRALSMGPVSVVTPIFGLFLVTSSILGIVFLDESFTARKGVAIGLAVASLYLMISE